MRQDPPPSSLCRPQCSVVRQCCRTGRFLGDKRRLWNWGESLKACHRKSVMCPGSEQGEWEAGSGPREDEQN